MALLMPSHEALLPFPGELQSISPLRGPPEMRQTGLALLALLMRSHQVLNVNIFLRG